MKSLKLCFFLMVVLSVSCQSAGKFYARKTTLQKDADLKTFYIDEMTTPFPENKEYVDFIESLKHELNRAFLKKGFVEDQETPDLKVNARVVYVNEGDPALRYFMGNGLGKGEAKILFEITDAQGVNLVEGTGVGCLVGGWWGGSMSDISMALAKDLIKQIKTGEFRSKY
jgi:hypothetical protein